jgi:hypothetical protein
MGSQLDAHLPFLFADARAFNADKLSGIVKLDSYAHLQSASSP